MTTQRELDRILDGFLADGTNELADRVIQAALSDIDRTPQRRHLRAPRRLPTMTRLQTRLAVAAVIGVLAVGGALYLTRPSHNGIGTPSTSPTGGTATVGPSPSGPAAEGRQLHTATTLANGRVLIAGGFGGRTGDSDLFSAQLFDPNTGALSQTGRLLGSRGWQTATLLRDGRVLIAG
ncbi:MAG TPA: hypothetical protein VNH13_05335, partial [Candidatus Acidoferrales bacterium]|nr:hypothetical protein [Candidatus Acidoferrales bacterium]